MSNFFVNQPFSVTGPNFNKILGGGACSTWVGDESRCREGKFFARLRRAIYLATENRRETKRLYEECNAVLDEIRCQKTGAIWS